MIDNPGKTLKIFNVSALINKACLSGVTPRNIIFRFFLAIFPLNVDVFPASEFAPSKVTGPLLLLSNSNQALDAAAARSVHVNTHTSNGLNEDSDLGFECFNVDTKPNAIVTFFRLRPW